MQIALTRIHCHSPNYPTPPPLSIKQSKTKLTTVQLSFSFLHDVYLHVANWNSCIVILITADQVFLRRFRPSSRHLTHTQMPLPRHWDYRIDLALLRLESKLCIFFSFDDKVLFLLSLCFLFFFFFLRKRF